MEEMISQILDYEKQAQEIVNRAKDRQVNIGVSITNEVDIMRKQYIDRAMRRIENYRDNEQEYLKNMIVEIDEKRISQLKRIKTAYEQSSGKWIKDIVNNIINDV